MLNYEKTIVPHDKLYIAKFTKKSNMPYLVFIHGGPGYNCGIVEYLIEHDNLFDSLNFNLVFYDQRSCGRSKNFSDNVLHIDNVNDLEEIYNYLVGSENLIIKGFIGHSYGAKLLFDFYKTFKHNIPGIFVATSNSILTPRLNNLIFDLAYLKKINPIKYNDILMRVDDVNLKLIWEITEELSPLFQENPDRHYLYWANLECYEKAKKIQKKLGLSVNTKTFMNVRKDIYSKENDFSVDINNLAVPYLWINGFHDFINEYNGILSQNKNIITLYKSAHYPHIEENKRFCEIINEFIEGVTCKKK